MPKKRKRYRYKGPPLTEAERKRRLKESLIWRVESRDRCLKMAEHFKPPKYPASTITEREKAHNAKYRKSYLNGAISAQRRIEELSNHPLLREE